MLPTVTQLFIDELIVLWNQTNPMISIVERNQFLNAQSLLQSANAIARKYQNLNGKGEYSVDFFLTSSHKKHQYYNWLINSIL